MGIISDHDPVNFRNYLETTQNTICGRHPISCLLWALKHSKQNFKTEFMM